jgi:release factor glutamine methyltransferase
VAISSDPTSLSALLAREGFIAAGEEAQELLAFAAGDATLLDGAVRRRLTGEPLAWITGRVTFCGTELHVDPNVYVPRWVSEPLAWRAVERLPAEGTAVDLCTGCGAIAKVLQVHRPRARVVAADLDPHAVRCAASNGVEVYRGVLFEPVPRDLEGRVDVVVAVAPYVPTPELPFLQRDTFTFETPLAYDGGPDGADILRRVLRDSRGFLRPGGVMLLEVGGDQADLLRDELAVLGYAGLAILTDEDGDVRGIEATFSPA